jgi:hypothetical protein
MNELIITRFFLASLSVFKRLLGCFHPLFFSLFGGQIMHVFGAVNGN